MDQKGVYAVLWRVKVLKNDADEVATAVQRVLATAQEGHEWPDKMQDSVLRQVILADGKCLYWALSAVEGKGRQAAADEVCRALTQGDMAQPLESGWARHAMQDAGVRTWAQYLDNVRTGKIWGGASEVRRSAHERGCKRARYREWGAKGVHQKMAVVDEGGRLAAALLWSRRGGGHYELLRTTEGEEEEEEGEEDKRETTDLGEVAMEVDSVTGGELAEDQGTRGQLGGED